jgi:hypothetical protein
VVWSWPLTCTPRIRMNGGIILRPRKPSRCVQGHIYFILYAISYNHYSIPSFAAHLTRTSGLKTSATAATGLHTVSTKATAPSVCTKSCLWWHQSASCIFNDKERWREKRNHKGMEGYRIIGLRLVGFPSHSFVGIYLLQTSGICISSFIFAKDHICINTLQC